MMTTNDHSSRGAAVTSAEEIGKVFVDRESLRSHRSRPTPVLDLRRCVQEAEALVKSSFPEGSSPCFKRGLPQQPQVEWDATSRPHRA